MNIKNENAKLLICLGLEAEYGFWKKNWNAIGKESESNVELTQLIQDEIDDVKKLSELREAMEQKEKTVVVYNCHGKCHNLPEWLKNLPEQVVRIPVGSEALLLNCQNVSGDMVEVINRYLLYGGDDNLSHAEIFLRKVYFGECMEEEVPAPIELAFDGIIENDSEKVYGSLQEYLASQSRQYEKYVGMLVHRHYWIRNDLESFWILKKHLEERGIGVVCVFSNGNSNCKNFNQITEIYFSKNGKLFISALVMAQMLPIMPKDGRSIAEQSVIEFEKLGIPVFHPVQSYYLTEEEWTKKIHPMTEELSNGYIIPEMSGMTEPVLISTREKESNRTVALPEQIQWLAGRIQSWLNLQSKDNAEKKVVLMLHNAVCNGVEATIGKAYGLDAMESAIQVMRRLAQEGYQVEDIPENGKKLLKLIQEKKAFSDFRWTAVEDIVESGGCLYRMGKSEYERYFSELSPNLQEYMNETWGPFPGEGMVLGNDIIITGLKFGNVLLMIQPKRGCYGAKCTGEVCKILHDPLCPPTHQYFASYRYLQHVFQADACVDIGTEGSLEFLPGKVNALAKDCWPRIVLDNMPLVYLYHAGVPGEGTTAKRRAHALAVTYLPSAMSGLNQKEKMLLKKVEEYTKAIEQDNGQEQILETEIRGLIDEIPVAARILANADDFRQGMRELSDAAATMERAAKGNVNHVFGINPNEEEKENYAAEAKDYDAEEICALLDMTAEAELRGVISALNGAYIPASECGMPDDNGKAILPTGRNFYGMKDKDFPGKAPYQRGIELANQLLETYQKDEGAYPQKIALNMISLDITRTGGEQLSEFLYLLGVRPVWDAKERVTGFEVIPVEELGRPRIDVTVRISGVLRDTWPMAVKIMDEAVLLVSSLEEAPEDNFVRKHMLEYQETYGDNLEREKTIRIFGDPPGGYGAGVDLALKASAWKDEKDLAKYFIQSSSFAYGKELDGEKKIREFTDNMKKVNVVSDIVQSKRNDLLSCGFSLNVQGGMALATKYLGGKKVRHYHATSEKDKPVQTETLAAVLERTIEETLLNPFWQEKEKQNEYDGASEIMAHIQHVFEAQCLMECVDDKTLDRLTESYVNDESMREWLLSYNPYAAEEIARRMLELVQRNKWNPDEEVLEKLKNTYLEIEDDMEDGLESKGDIQAGTIEIVSHTDLESWQKKMNEVEKWME